jgi:hypothetical protein
LKWLRTGRIPLVEGAVQEQVIIESEDAGFTELAVQLRTLKQQEKRELGGIRTALMEMQQEMNSMRALLDELRLKEQQSKSQQSDFLVAAEKNPLLTEAAMLKYLGKDAFIIAIIEEMRGHREHAEVQKQGCWALRMLAANGENKVKIAEAGGIKAIIEGMGTHRENEDVQEQGCWS